MKYAEPLLKARLIKRYKRFLADVVLDDGTEMTIHTANTGSMNGCAIADSIIWISNSHNLKRKYLYSWELSTTENGHLIGINTILANKLAKEAIEKGFISELNDVLEITTEVPYGAEKSRIDLLLKQKNGQKCYVEVKNVTASFEPGVAAFPDAVTARGTKHLRELELMVQQGHRAVILFCVQREDIHSLRAAQEIDPVYAQTLKEVAKNGVEVLAYAVQFLPGETPLGIELNRKLSVIFNFIVR